MVKEVDRFEIRVHPFGDSGVTVFVGSRVTQYYGLSILLISNRLIMTSAEFHGAKIVNPPPDWKSEVGCTPLYVEFITIEEGECILPLMKSVWVPSPKEREALAAGANIALRIVGVAHPPVQVALADVEVVLDDNPFGDWKEH